MRWLALAVLVTVATCHAVTAAAPTVAFLPLDERFTTRDAFVNLACVTPFHIETPPTSVLPHLRTPASLPGLDAWANSTLPHADALLASSEMFLYGGLIASRASNASTADVLARLNALLAFKQRRPSMKLLLSAVVMRVEDANGAFEDPWYDGQWGTLLFEYSYNTDAYRVTGNATYRAAADKAAARIPPSVLQQFLWAHARNLNVTAAMVQAVAASPGVVDHLYITLDDSGAYGIDIAAGRTLRAMVARLNLQGQVLIYPGADEVGLCMLSKYAVAWAGRPVTLGVVYRNASTIDAVPNYEGQPMVDTLLDQVAAAGATAVNASGGTGAAAATTNATVLVNNFDTAHQMEAAAQPMSPPHPTDFSMFTAAACAGSGRHPVGFADNRYSNGADRQFVAYMSSLAGGTCGLQLAWTAYAGWNTDGNTLGTVLANTVLLALFGGQSGTTAGNTYFNALRIVEDSGYQAGVRQTLTAYVTQTANDTVDTLGNDLPFYERFVYKVLYGSLRSVADTFDVPLHLSSVYFPWNRTFEVGLYAA